jgi:hypothetical protein
MKENTAIKSVDVGDKKIISSFTSLADLERVFGVGKVLASIMVKGVPTIKTLDEITVNDIPNAVFFVYK